MADGSIHADPEEPDRVVVQALRNGDGATDDRAMDDRLGRIDRALSREEVAVRDVRQRLPVTR